MAGTVKKAVNQRLSGDRPSPPVAALAAIAAGVGAAMLTYRVLRS